MPSITIYVANKYMPYLMKDGKGNYNKALQEIIKWALFDKYGSKLKEDETRG